MYIFQNAFKNILRNRGRNILIGSIIFVIIITTVVALMINNTTSGIIDDYKGRFGAEISLVANMEKLREQAMANSTDGRVKITQPVIPADQYITFGQSEYLQSSVYTASVGVNSSNVKTIAAELGGGSGMMIMGGGGPGAQKPATYMMKLLGNEFNDFKEGVRDIGTGRMPEKQNECIISTDLAELNNLSAGDKLSVTSELTDNEMNATEITYDLTIVGTYYDATDEYASGAQQNAYTNRRNEILTTYDTVVQAFIPEHRGIKVSAKYYLKNPDLLDAFAKEVYAKGLDPVFDVTTDKAGYNKIVGPVEGLKSISITFMVIVQIFGGIIIILLSSIAIRERKYEIGVLRAMGMKKHKVALGLWAEMLIITCVCLVIGLGTGTLTAQPVTDTLLSGQIAAAQEAEVAQANMGGLRLMQPAGASTADSVEPLSNIEISLGADTVFQIMGISLLLASLAGLISISRITKYEPIKILMERN
jgi:putative ABC transport system permease protein